jgi:hypothetical protein
MLGRGLVPRCDFTAACSAQVSRSITDRFTVNLRTDESLNADFWNPS